MRAPDLTGIYKNYTLSDFHNAVSSRITYRIENLRRALIHNRGKKNELHSEEVEIVVKRGRKWLENQQRSDGSIGKIEPRQWEIWDTANAALALIETGGDKDCINRAINFSLGGQLENGSFYFNYVPKSLKENFNCNCIETAGVVLLAAYKNGKKDLECMRRGIDFLIKAQNKDGSWELPYLPVPKYPSVTGYALKTLLYNKMCSENTLDKALSFLETAQQRNGSWGRAFEYYNTESYAIKNITEALMLARNKELLNKEDKEKIDAMLQRCLSYVIKQQNLDGSWSAIGQSSKCISTALYLQTILNMSDKIERNEIIIDASTFLIEKQENDGYWKGGKLGKYPADLFATSEALISLNKASEFMKKVRFFH